MLRISIIILSLFCTLVASAQLPPVLPMAIGSGVPTGNTFIFVDSASARPVAVNTTVVATPARSYTNSTVIFVQTIDYPNTVSQPSTIEDNNGNVYVTVFNQIANGVNNERIKVYKCFNPNVTGGLTITYKSSGGVANYACIYAQGYRGITSDPNFQTNSGSTAATVSSISTNSVTVTASNSLVISSLGVGAIVTTAPNVSGSVTLAERMNWFPRIANTTSFNASYNSIKTSPGTFSVTHSTSGADFSSQTIASIVAFY